MNDGIIRSFQANALPTFIIMNIVLITSGLNALAREFATLPGKPAGIIYIHSRETVSGISKILRFFYKTLLFRKYVNLEQYCQYHNIEYASIYKRDEEQLRNVLQSWDCDLAITSCCPLIPMSAIEELRHGAINVHPSLLPDYRGGNPLFWQVYEQTPEIGVTVHYLEKSADTGPIISSVAVDRPKAKSQKELSNLLEGELSPKLLSQVITDLLNDHVHVKSQPKKSRTRYACNFELENFQNYLNLEEINLPTLWDLTHYFGCWPNEIARYSSWRKWFKWIPVELISSTDSNTDVINGKVEFDGVNTWLRHKEGSIRLRPKAELRYLLRMMNYL